MRDLDKDEVKRENILKYFRRVGAISIGAVLISLSFAVYAQSGVVEEY